MGYFLSPLRGCAPPEKPKPVERLVAHLLAAKAQDASADVSLRWDATATQVSAVERELDELVYALYVLTPEEIQIVQSASVKTPA